MAEAGKDGHARAGAMTARETFARGLLAENPSLRQMLGLCPTLAVTTAVTNGLGMGLATTFVLVCSEVVVSLLRKLIPDSVRIPAFITVIASFVTLTMMLVKAYLPTLDDALGIYLPLIVVNCIVLGRAEMFASKHGPALSALDGLGMGLGFTGSLVLMSAIRELLGAGTLLGFQVMPSCVEPMIIMVTPAGGFAVLGVLIAASVWLEHRGEEPDGRPKGVPSDTLCAACPIGCGVNDPHRVNCADGTLAEQLRRFEERVERELADSEAAKLRYASEKADSAKRARVKRAISKVTHSKVIRRKGRPGKRRPGRHRFRRDSRR